MRIKKGYIYITLLLLLVVLVPYGSAGVTEKILAQAVIGTGSPTTVHTGTDTDIIKIIFITNTTSSDATIELWVVKNADSPDDDNALISGYTIPANDFMQITTYIPLETTGDTIQAEASAATTLTVQLFGASST